MTSKSLSVCFTSFLFVAACSSSGTEGGNGGSSASGGHQNGGSGAGGTPGAGGTSSAGGSASGGTTSNGGTTTATGGKVGSGGATTSSGGAGAGGAATGGTVAKGGSTGSGGTPMGSGGAAGAGSGGAVPRDGGVGGSAGAGGGSTGGAAGGGAGGGSTVVSQCGLPPGPSSGVAAPTGSGTKLDVLPWAGFKAATSFSFDDNNQSQIDNYDKLNAMGVHLTFYMVTSWSSAGNAVWKQAIKDGHEIGNHTQTHVCSTASAGQSDLKSKFGLTAYTLAAPNGDTSCGSYVSSLNLLLNRGVNGGSISFTASDTVANNLNTALPATGAAASSLTSAIDGAYSKGEWQTFCIHGFTGDANAYQPIPLASVTDAVKTEKEKKDLWIDTMQAVGGYWRAAMVFSKATSATSGTDKTWKWTPPANIPPNTCLRVKSDGGVVKQKGTAVPWDAHGYYEISFNAGEVTLSAQ